MIPVFMIYRQLGWVDTLRPLWVPGFFAIPFYVFLLRQFFLTIPRELEDAAKIDGCGYWRIYWGIMLPQIRPALAAVAIMHFLGSWNDFMGPLIYISSPEKMTGSYALQLFQSAHGGEWALLMAAATLWTIPILLLFFFAQRYFIQGVTLTGIKG
jgi:multiple sugar transport system permease protein